VLVVVQVSARVEQTAAPVCLSRYVRWWAQPQRNSKKLGNPPSDSGSDRHQDRFKTWGGLSIPTADNFDTGISPSVISLPRRSHSNSSSSRRGFLNTVKKLTTLGDRTFAVATALVWNNLSHYVTSAPTVTSFRRSLKTYFCNRAYE
jgi:hypothetical protein